MNALCCSCFLALFAGDADFCHLIALNAVRDSIDAPAPEVEAGAQLPGWFGLWDSDHSWSSQDFSDGGAFQWFAPLFAGHMSCGVRTIWATVVGHGIVFSAGGIYKGFFVHKDWGGWPFQVEYYRSFVGTSAFKQGHPCVSCMDSFEAGVLLAMHPRYWNRVGGFWAPDFGSEGQGWITLNYILSSSNPRRGIYSDNSSGIKSGILSDILSHMYSDIRSEFHLTETYLKQ